MGPYSHYILAARLEPFLLPAQREDYFWGAVVPDIRYLANMRRDHTHLTREQMKERKLRYPRLRAFITGYQAHLLIDEVDVALAVSSTFPLSLFKDALRRRISHQQMTMLVELYYLQSGRADAPLSGEYNEVLADLGVTAQQARMFYEGLQEYFAGRSFEAAMQAFQKIGMIENDRVAKYLRAYQALQKQSILNALLMISIKNSRLDTRVVDFVRKGMAES